MSSCSLPLVLLVLICVQSFTMAQADPKGPAPPKGPASAKGPAPAKGPPCCFTFQEEKVPVQLITEYKETPRFCPNPGIIFIMKSGRRVCADPRDQWVKDLMDNIDLCLRYMEAQTELKLVVRGPLDDGTGPPIQCQRFAGLTKKRKVSLISGKVGGVWPGGMELCSGPRYSESRTQGRNPQGLAGSPSATTTRSPARRQSQRSDGSSLPPATRRGRPRPPWEPGPGGRGGRTTPMLLRPQGKRSGSSDY